MADVDRTPMSTAIKKRLGRGGRGINGTQDPNGPLTQKQRDFIHYMAEERYGQTEAARLAGYKHAKNTGIALMQNPKITKAVAEGREKYRAAANMERKRVVEGFLEAVDIARTKADPMAMVGAWREIGRMCGFYEPTKTELKVSVDGKVMLHQLQNMSDEDLLQLIAEEQKAKDEALDAEYEEIVDVGRTEEG